MKLYSIMVIAGLLGLISCRNRVAEKKDYMPIYERYNQGKVDEALVMLHDYTKKYPKNFNGWTFLGVIEFQQGNDSIAEIAFKKALEIRPNTKQALTGLGVIYRIKGLYNEAEKLYKKSIEIDPNFAEAYSSLVIIELLKQDFNNAVMYGEKAWELDNMNGNIAANLSLAYHYSSNEKLSTELFNKAKELDYSDIVRLELALKDIITLNELINTSHNNGS